ncbi:hypothetical protein D3C78_720940 [compost metagenome]
MPETSFRYCSPAGVRVTPLALRRNSGRPISASRLAIWWLTAEGVRFSCSAALATLPKRAACSKAWMALSGGICRGFLPFSLSMSFYLRANRFFSLPTMPSLAQRRSVLNFFQHRLNPPALLAPCFGPNL